MIVEAIYSTCYNYLCFFIVIITTEKNAWMRVLLLITNQGVVLIEKKKHQRLACLVALARVYSTLIISEVTRDNGRTKIMFLVIVAMFLYLGSLDLWSLFLLFCCWSECLVLCCSNIIVVFLFLTRQKLYVDYVFLRLRFFHYANRELSFKIVHEQ